MRAYEHLLRDQIDPEELVAGQRLTEKTWFWVVYSLFMMAIGALSMWAFFKYVVME